MTIARKVARRLYDGTGNAAAHAAHWARNNKGTAALAALAGGSGLPTAIHNDPRIAAAIAAGWTWTAWRTTTRPSPDPSRDDKPPTSDDSGQKGQPESGGVADITDIKTVSGTARRRPHPTQPNRTIIEWDKP
jgi:hypothetical protein